MKTLSKLTQVEKVAHRAVEIGALQKVAELEEFLKLAKKENPRVVVEIGTARGGTLYALCQIASPDATIISIDLPEGPFGGGYTPADTTFFRTFKKNGQALHFILQDSHKVETVRAVAKILKGRKIDLLFIDGDHTYGGVKRDWDWYVPMVRPGGLVALHDIVFHQNIPECQVDRLWMELRNQHRVEMFIDGLDQTWGGIGVVHLGEAPKKTVSTGILLDISPIPNKQPNFTGMAKRQHPNVEIVHDMEKFPWPLKDSSCHVIVGHNILHHVKPWLMLDFMDEVWRVLKPGGQVAFAVPYAGSPGYYADPLSCNPINETTFFYFDPQYRNLYDYYKPKPWMLEKGTPQWSVTGNLEVALRPRK